MKEKFTKLFGALMLVALLLGFVMPFQAASAQEEMPQNIAFASLKASGGDINFNGINITPGDSSVVSPAVLTPFIRISRAVTETGTKTVVADNLITAAGTAAGSWKLAASPFLDTTADAGTLYWYWAQLCDVSGNSCSAYGSGVTGWRWVPDAVSTITVTGGGTALYDKVLVTLTNVIVGAALPPNGAYQIFRNKSAAITAFVDSEAIGKTASLVYNDFGAAGQLKDGTVAPTYGYAVDTCGKDKCARQNTDSTLVPPATYAYTMVASTFTGIRKVLAAGPALVRTNGSGKVSFTWIGIVDATSYYGERQFGSQMDGNGTFQAATLPNGDVITSTYSYEDSWNLVAGNNYDYWLWACVSPGTENCSPSTHVVGTPTQGISMVKDLTFSKGDNMDESVTPNTPATGVAVKFTGLPNSALYSYKLFRYENSAATLNGIVTVLPGVVSNAPMKYVDALVDPGVSYYYILQVCEVANTANCAKSAVTEAWGRIPTPKNFVVTNSTSGISATWSAVAGSNVFYRGWRAATNSFTGAEGPSASIAATSGSDNGGVAGTTYWYFLQACVGTRCSDPTVGTPGIKLK
jgi:hypothetical protein